MNTDPGLTTAQLKEKWKDVIYDLPVPTWTEPECLAICAENASHSDHAVEIGTYMGMSALTMLRASPQLHLWCVDIFTAFEFNQDVAAYFLRDYIKQGRCELIRGNSDRARSMLNHMVGKLDLVWVDGSHATEDVLKDMYNFMPMIRPGGLMTGHDFDVNPYNNVAQAVLKSGYKFTLPFPRLWSVVKE